MYKTSTMEDPDRTYCKLCLVTDVKMHSLNTPSILEAYSQLLQVVIDDDSKTYICYECKTLLFKYQEFRLKCVTSHNVLTSLNVDHSKITKKLIKSIDRNAHNLVSKFTPCSILVCDSKDQYLIPNNCMNSEAKKKNNIESELEMESNIVEVKLEIDTCDTEIHDLNENKDQDMTASSEITIQPKDELNENLTNTNKDRFQQIKLKQKCLPKLKKPTANTSSTAQDKKKQINCEKNASNLKDKPIAKTRKKKLSQGAETLKDEPIAKKSKSKKVKKKKLREGAEELENYLSIETLNPMDIRKKINLRRESKNYTQNPHKCDLCYKGFMTKTTYDNHMKKHSSEFGDIECEYCHVRFHKKNLMNLHVAYNHERKFNCKTCPFVCYSQNQAYAHMNTHKGKKFECKECGKCFRASSTLSTHKHANHKRELVCTQCGDMFGSPPGLNRHQKIIHKQDSTDLLGPKCEECDIQFTTETAWKRHLVISSKHTVSNGCIECGESFPTEESLKIHRRTHPRKIYHDIYNGFNPPAACEMCNKWLTTRREYAAHVKSDHPSSVIANRIKKKEKSKKALVSCCEVCGLVCKNKWQLEAHQVKHTDEQRFECSECRKKFRYRCSLYQHMNMHTRRRVYECDLCQKQYYTKFALIKHINDSTELLGPKCEECDVQFTTETAWKRHLVLSSKHTVSNGCGVCGETFNTEEGLRIHRKTHPPSRTNYKTYRRFTAPDNCKICNKMLETQSEYMKHMKSAHSSSHVAKKIKHFPRSTKKTTPAVCEVCGKVAMNVYVLRDHLLTHINKHPFECGECGKKFTQRSSLRTHQNVHTRQHVYECDVCQKQYSNKLGLTKHIKVHFGFRPYECSYCHKRFIYNYERRMHIEYVHFSKPWPQRERSKRSAKIQSVSQ